MYAYEARRAFADLTTGKGEIRFVVPHIAGHASVDTTRRYDRRPEETKRKAAGKLHFPY